MNSIHGSHHDAGLASSALAYAANGYVTLPLSPLSNSPHGLALGSGWHFCSCTGGDPLVGSLDPGVIQTWWEQDPRANLGVVTGARSRLLVIDVDTHHGNGHAEFAQWRRDRETEGKTVPDHPAYDTPSGGVQRWFALPVGLHLKTNLHWLRDVEVKACGGQVAVPPSVRAVKRAQFDSDGSVIEWTENVPYAWRNGPTTVPLAPDWLLEDVTTRFEKPRGGASQDAGGSCRDATLPTTADLLRTGFSPGSRDRDCHALACRLWRLHWPHDHLVIDGVRRVWERTEQPPDQSPFTWNDALRKIESARRFVAPQREEESAFVARFMKGILL